MVVVVTVVVLGRFVRSSGLKFVDQVFNLLDIRWKSRGIVLSGRVNVGESNVHATDNHSLLFVVEFGTDDNFVGSH